MGEEFQNHLLAMVDDFNQWAEAAWGYREVLVRKGFSEGIAEMIAAQWLSDLQRRMILGA